MGVNIPIETGTKNLFFTNLIAIISPMDRWIAAFILFDRIFLCFLNKLGQFWPIMGKGCSHEVYPAVC